MNRPVALLTYSTRPRGGVVHVTHLAEALHAVGRAVHLYALGDPAAGFFRPVRAPHTVLPAPPPAERLEDRVFAAVDALAEGLDTLLPDPAPLLHAQDCISARAATRLRDGGRGGEVLRTVHHVDTFTTPALVECQRRSILDPDALLVVSNHWRGVLRQEYGRAATVVTNGVDIERFARPPASTDLGHLRDRVGARDRPLLLTVGGIEPRKGSMELIEAMGQLRNELAPAPVLAVVGGHSFQDYAAYRAAALARAGELGLTLGVDLVLLGTVDDEELPAWYHAADAFVFPSVKEGFGLVVLEALAAGLPVVTSDLPVFREYLVDEVTALLAPPGDSPALAGAVGRVLADGGLRRRLAAEGPGVAIDFTWARCAAQHEAIYAAVGPGAAATLGPSS